MSVYNVYLKDNKVQLVKCGFSWPILFFSWMWFFYYKMFLHGFTWMFGYLGLCDLCILFFINHLSTIDRFCICIILYFVAALLPAFSGGKFLEEKLFMEGWRYKCVIKASNIKQAKHIISEL